MDLINLIVPFFQDMVFLRYCLAGQTLLLLVGDPLEVNWSLIKIKYVFSLLSLDMFMGGLLFAMMFELFLLYCKLLGGHFFVRVLGHLK